MSTDRKVSPVNKGTRTKHKVVIISTALSAVLVASYLFTAVVTASVAPPAHTKSDVASSIPTSFADLIEEVKPAVVNISTTSKVPGAGPWSKPRFQTPPPNYRMPYGPRFEEFFRRFFGEPLEPHGDAPAREVHALGSGFIIDPSGYVVTNNHVIDRADEITVVLNDGTRYEAELKGRDAKTDLALLKIESSQPFAYVAFGDSDKTRVGDWVVAIGNPFGLGGTATTGIVSARGRDIQSGPFDDFIQIDAPINRGNSGGPLFDTSGKVIGVNTAIFSPNGGNVGIGFAIPASLAEFVIAQLREHGKVERGWLGIQIQTVTEEIADSLELKEPKGALVTSVVPNGPAAKAGVLPGDVIVAYNGTQVTRMRNLPRLVAETKADKEIKIKVWRKGKEQTLRAVIASMPSDETIAADEGTDDKRPDGQLGLTLAMLTPEIRQQYGLPEDTEGVLIVDVRSNSPAAEKGLRVGDVIVMVGQKKVSQPKDVAQEVKQATGNKRQTVLLLVERGGSRQFVALNLA